MPAPYGISEAKDVANQFRDCLVQQMAAQIARFRLSPSYSFTPDAEFNDFSSIEFWERDHIEVHPHCYIIVAGEERLGGERMDQEYSFSQTAHIYDVSIVWEVSFSVPSDGPELMYLYGFCVQEAIKVYFGAYLSAGCSFQPPIQRVFWETLRTEYYAPLAGVFFLGGVTSIKVRGLEQCIYLPY